MPHFSSRIRFTQHDPSRLSAHLDGCLEAGRIFARLADLLSRGLQPPSSKAITLTSFDA